MSKKEIMHSIQNRDREHLAHRERPTEESHQTLGLSRCMLTTAKATAKVKWLESKLDEIEKINNEPQSAWKLIKEINAGFSDHHEKAVI
jgi:hypothetical protein